jgi:hypothetical protein
MIKTIRFDEFEYYMIRMKEFNDIYLFSVVDNEENCNAKETKDVREGIKFEKETEADGYLSQLIFPNDWEIIKVIVQYKIA